MKGDAWLNARGYTVMRFLNAQVVSEPDGVMLSVLARASRDAELEA